MNRNPTITAGHPAPLGASFDGAGVNFALFSQHGSRVQLCLFDARGRETRLDLPERDGHVWHGYIPGLRPGQKYGYRVDGPYVPAQGHRFNPNKLLIDPYAKRLTGSPVQHDALLGYRARDRPPTSASIRVTARRSCRVRWWSIRRFPGVRTRPCTTR